jgi:hypothetical protein
MKKVSAKQRLEIIKEFKKRFTENYKKTSENSDNEEADNMMKNFEQNK